VATLLDEISKRGIPVLKRIASGGSHSRGELGVLLAVRLLQDAFRQPGGGVRLPVFAGSQCVHLILPVDSYWEPLLQCRRVLDPGSSEERPDLLVFSIHLPSNGNVQVKVTPVEVKFREAPMGPQDLGNALRQAGNLGRLLDGMWAQPAPNELWATCGRALLAQCLDQCFRVYADPAIHGGSNAAWASIHERVLHDILGGQAAVTVNRSGRLLVFDTSPTTSIVDMDGDGRQDTAVVSAGDAEFLLAGQGGLSAAAEGAVRVLDFSLPMCDPAGTAQGAAPPAPPTTPPAPPPVPAPAAPVDQTGEVPQERPIEEETAAADGDDLPFDAGSADVLPPPDAAQVQSPVPPEIREQVRVAFEGFIGNEAAIRRVKNDLLRALIEKPPYLSKNYLFTGQPSTGKTELARRMASALGLPFVRLDGRGVATRERLFLLVKGELAQQGLSPSQAGQQAGLPVLEYPPLVIFIDEAHLMPRSVQESLLTMLEAADRTVTLADEVARVSRATFLFATTRASDIDPAFRSRCTEVQLREYDQAEVAEILTRRFQRDWPREVYLEIAKLGRTVPRVAIELANELETEITVSEHQERTPAEHLDEVRRAREIDSLGLTQTDIRYLEVLEQEGRPVGEQAVTNILGTVDRDRVVDEVEPFLRRLGFIRLGARGREITAEGRQYLLSRRRYGQS
jgi:Holliday junction resolvasome RuvABC ATP-dependent DNA helicase subunit